MSSLKVFPRVTIARAVPLVVLLALGACAQVDVKQAVKPPLLAVAPAVVEPRAAAGRDPALRHHPAAAPGHRGAAAGDRRAAARLPAAPAGRLRHRRAR